MPTIISDGFVLRSALPLPVLQMTAVFRHVGRSGCAPRRDFCIAQHDDYQVLIDVAELSGAPADLSGLTEARWIVAKKVASATAEIDKTLSGGGIRLGASSQLYLGLSSAETGALAAGVYHHELRLTTALGHHQTVTFGALTVQDTWIGDN